MKKIILLAISVFIYFSCSPVSSGENDSLSVIEKSEDYFKRALVSEREEEKKELFIRSASLLEGLISSSAIDNGYIYYNAANSWMNSGNIGKAILNYRKAEERIPSNHMVRNNLSIARLSVENIIERKEENALLRALLFFHYDLSFEVRFYLIIFLITILCTSASIALYKKNKILKNIQIISAVFLICFGISLFVDTIKSDEGVIIYKNVTARKGDSEGYERSFAQDLTEGVEFTVISQRNQWYYIELSDGNRCWIPTDSAELID